MGSRAVCGMAVLVLCLSAGLAGAQTTLVQSDFTDMSVWNDLSTVLPWGGYSQPTSAFTHTGQGLTLSAAARSHSGYTASTSLKTFTALDFQFPEPIQRGPDVTITATFMAKWSSGSMSGEGSRLVLSYTHDYPENGLDMTYNSRWNDFSYNGGAAWARPAYNMRIRPGGSNTSMMMYGGGHNPWGEFEKTSDWWLAGFSSGPGEHSPQPGTHGVVGCGTGLWSTTEFKEYQYILTPTHQELWFEGNLVGSQALDVEYDDLGFRVSYPQIEGIRLYWRGASESQAILQSMTVTVIPEPATLALLALGGVFVARRRRR